MNFNNNISSLFGSLNGNNSFGSINFSDYASIKNGSYGKLLKSYYAKQNASGANGKDKTNTTTNKKDLDVDSTGLNKLKTKADSLKKSTDALKKDDLWKANNGNYDWEKITSAVKTFASDYNAVVEESGNVSSRDVSQNTDWMTSLSSTMKNALSKVGVTVGTDNKLSVDEEKLKKADVKNLKALFNGPYSYAEQVSQKASSISSAALRGTSLYSNDGSYSSVLSSYFNQGI